MSDRELIVNFLEKAAKRARFNKRFNDIAIALAIAFVVPVLFKLLDLLFLFRGRTVVTFLSLWAVATVVWIVTRVRGKSSLSQVAGSIDSKEHLAGLFLIEADNLDGALAIAEELLQETRPGVAIEVRPILDGRFRGA